MGVDTVPVWTVCHSLCAAGVYIDKTGDTEIDHDVEVVGWGEEGGVKYWIVSGKLKLQTPGRRWLYRVLPCCGTQHVTLRIHPAGEYTQRPAGDCTR